MPEKKTAAIITSKHYIGRRFERRSWRLVNVAYWEIHPILEATYDRQRNAYYEADTAEGCIAIMAALEVAMEESTCRV